MGEKTELWDFIHTIHTFHCSPQFNKKESKLNPDRFNSLTSMKEEKDLNLSKNRS